MRPEYQIPAPTTAGSALRRQNPEHFVRLLEAHLSALIDARDTPGWKINPAYHPDVIGFVEAYGNNSGFVKRAKALQKNRGDFYARTSARQGHRPTVLQPNRTTVVDSRADEAIPMAIPMAIPIPRAIPVK
jgi:hypothetical protein